MITNYRLTINIFTIVFIFITLSHTSYCLDDTSFELDKHLGDRLNKSHIMQAYLKSLDDEHILKLIDYSELKSIGTGGESRKIIINNQYVFIKVIPIGDKEKDKFSTKNIYNLPLSYSYGFGSFGFTVWREVIAHKIVNKFVKNHNIPYFPLMHHYRLIKYKVKIKNIENNISALEARWCNDNKIKKRIYDYLSSSYAVVLFLEYFPQTLGNKLLESVNDLDKFDNEFKKLVPIAFDAVEKMNQRGFFHFDLHLDNILTDGQLIYIIDLALTKAPIYDLAKNEQEFLISHKNFDKYYLTYNLGKFLSNTVFKNKNLVQIKRIKTISKNYYFASWWKENYTFYTKMLNFTESFKTCPKKLFQQENDSKKSSFDE